MPASALMPSPASRPIFSASAGAPVLVARYICWPSSDDTRPSKRSSPSTMRAWPAMGVLQLPSRAARKARSQETQVKVSSWLSAAMYFSARASSSRHWMPMAPWATAGSISSHSRTAVTSSAMSMRLRPAYARSVASTTPSSSLRSRVCTLPRKLTHLSVGLMARICDCLRSDAEPMTEPSLRSLRLLAVGEMKTSRVSSRSSMHGSTVFAGSHVGTSFIECTQMSTSSPRSATSSSLVKRPLPPISLSALSRIMSPCVFMMQSWIAPSPPSSSGKFFISSSRVM
mmetsp:Transcript_10996/g.37882  ORF Transcript_10996/g.37882 Transcript_10996/m.37882 type:complete len:285 (+) Transcript_10996:122-976(+)